MKMRSTAPSMPISVLVIEPEPIGGFHRLFGFNRINFFRVEIEGKSGG